ncbi:hypothetical protein P3T37_004929 [Kitasatospora sp. MAA4]|uniref:hypothetical protein n=1 Tax=Kitasatospora sp. MAA4 TaxID=3035093 RepID=UPI00247463A0|nr:hypothetical protein [Kitasatospora sp. MAA4]MDH6135513.1 hypothetical protein [Kitasatospora sp. MAA4]
MHVNFIAPERYVRASHDIVRHPRLRATAKTLLLWALSLPPGSRDTILTLGNRMPEGRTAVSRARSQLIEEGYLHVRRTQHPTRGTWTTRLLISSVPLTDPDQIAAAWNGVDGAVRKPTLGEPGRREVGTSPLGKKNEENTALPAEGEAEGEGEDEAVAAASLLDSLIARDKRLRLGWPEALALAPLVADWLARDPDLGRLGEALTGGLPTRIISPAGLLRTRLEQKMPPPPKPAPPPRIAGECTRCADPVPARLSGGTCLRCAGLAPAAARGPDLATVERNRRGAARARSLLRTCVPPTG